MSGDESTKWASFHPTDSTPPREIDIQDLVEVWFWESDKLLMVNHEGNPIVDYHTNRYHVKKKGVVENTVGKERYFDIGSNKSVRGLVLRKGTVTIKETKGDHWMLKSIDTFDILVPEHGCLRVVYDPKDRLRSIYKMTPELYSED